MKKMTALRPPASTGKTKSRGLSKGYRSGLEESTATLLASKGIPVKYETEKIQYIIPEAVHRYTPDFILPNGVIIETKGYFTADDRKKHLLIKEQHPKLDIRFLFSRAKQRLSKTSKTSYADWCNKNGFVYAEKVIPDSWLKNNEVGNG